MRPTLPSAVRLALEPRVRAGRGVVLGRDVHFEVAPDAQVVLGDGCSLGEHTRVVARGARVELGAGVVVGERVTIVAHAGVTVGDQAELADGAVIVDFNHAFDDVELPIRVQPLTAERVVIGAGARIGLGASVLPGVSVGEGALVGPHAVVTGDVPAAASVEGVPARPVSRGRARD